MMKPNTVASGLCLDDGSDVYISGDVEADSQILCSDYGTYHLDFAFDDAETDTKSLTLSQYDSLNNKINLEVGLDKTLRNISQVSVGSAHTCVLTNAGTIKCWGGGDNGQLGNGAIDRQSTAVDVVTSETDSSPLDGIAAISAGGSWTCALTDRGSVKCWGWEDGGRLGNRVTGFDNVSSTPVDVHTSATDNAPLAGITAISTGSSHTCAITTAGTVKCWGKGEYGKLGNGATTDETTPIDVCARAKTGGESTCPKLTGIVAIAAGWRTTCALTDRGSVKCWGRNSDGQLGNGTNVDAHYPVDVHTSATESNPLADISSIGAGNAHFCALNNSGNIKCWGSGANGKLGNGGTTDRLTPVSVCAQAKAGGEESCPVLRDIVSINLGGNHACALTTSGTVKCWGSGTSGRLGNGGTSGSNYPVDVHTGPDDSNTLSGVTAIRAGNNHTCALTNEDHVKCWGYGEAGQMGNGQLIIDNPAPVDVISSSWNPIEPPIPSYGEDFYVDTQTTSHTFSLQGKCSIHGSAIEISGDVVGTPTTTCSDYGRFNLEIPLSSGASDKTLTITQTLEGKTETNTLTLQNDGDYFLLEDIAMVSAGDDHVCALTNSGNVKCWGRGEYGILGNGKTSRSSVPVDVHTSSTDSSPLSDIASIVSGNVHTCALTTDGEVKCWGNGINRQLGNGENSASTTPVSVCERAKTGAETICPPLSSIAAITVQGNTTCVLTDSNTVKCWGYGVNGQLGNGADSASNTPVDVHTDSGNSDALSGIAAISGLCALTDSGNVKCWGAGDNGQLGNGGTTNSNTPVDVCARAKTGAETTCPALADIAAISTGEYHRCALTDSGTLKCWGDGSQGQLGNGATTATNSYPVDVRTSSSNSDDLSGVESISLGGRA